ncbi:MAG: hypothetical protein ABIZ69_05885 [Ilumatobacteraceae bacterium]
MTWFVGGAVAGVASVGVAKRKMKQAATHLTPTNIVHGITGRVHDAFSEGRKAMRARETELRSRLDDPAGPLADDLEDGDASVADRAVEPGQVIVLKQVRDRSGDHRRRRA